MVSPYRELQNLIVPLLSGQILACWQSHSIYCAYPKKFHALAQLQNAHGSSKIHLRWQIVVAPPLAPCRLDKLFQIYTRQPFLTLSVESTTIRYSFSLTILLCICWYNVLIYLKVNQYRNDLTSLFTMWYTYIRSFSEIYRYCIVGIFTVRLVRSVCGRKSTPVYVHGS